MIEKPNLGAGSVTIELKSLPLGVHPVRVDLPGLAFELGGESPSNFQDAVLEGTVERGESFARFRGTVRGDLESTCDRCLSRFGRSIETGLELDVVLTEERPGAGAGHAGMGDGEDEEETLVLPADAVVDLTGPMREAVLLEIPIKNLCREDCRGLCPVCGVNRNLEACACEPTPRDSRWSALREISFPSDAQE